MTFPICKKMKHVPVTTNQSYMHHKTSSHFPDHDGDHDGDAMMARPIWLDPTVQTATGGHILLEIESKH